MMRWEYLKYKVRDFSKQCSVDKARERKAKRNKLELRAREFEVLISSNVEETFMHEYHDCKHQLEKIYNHITQGIILRSKVDMEKTLLNIFLILKGEIRQNLI